MKALYIYNQHSAIEVSMIERVRNELSNYVQDVQIMDMDTAKETYGIRATPALIMIRDDLQGENLLDDINGQLRLTAELCKALDEEDRNLHQIETCRIDNLIIAETSKAVDAAVLEAIERGV